MKYEGLDDGASLFGSFRFVTDDRKGETSTGSFVNRPVEPWRLDKGETDYAVIRKKNNKQNDCE